MYRKASSTSVLSGVPTGSYTGGKRVLDGARLEASTRERLHKVLAMRGTPAPIAYEKPASQASSRPVWGVIGATMGLSTLFAVGFGNLDSDWATQPWWALTLYLGLGFGFAASLRRLLERRALFAGSALLRPGRYLFPLDAIDIALPDAKGRQLVTVHPLGDARHADVEIEGKKVELVLRFEDGTLLRFPLRGDHKGTVALRRLEHAQRLLEDLTYKESLEVAFQNDLFFDLRVDNAWKKFAPLEGNEAASSSETTAARPNLMSLAVGRYAPVVLAVVTLGLGAGTFFVRREAGDTALYNHAVAYGSSDAIDRYLARGGRKVLAAQDVKTRYVDAEKLRRQREQEWSAKERGDLGAFDAEEDPRVDEKCIDALQARASGTHPKAVPALVRAIQARSRQLRFGVDVLVDPTVEHGRRDLAAMNYEAISDGEVVYRAFGRVLADICPRSVIDAGSADRYDGRGVIVRVKTKVARLAARQLRVDFIVLLIEKGQEIDRFELSVPPPAEPPLYVRPQSLFSIETPKDGGPAEATDERVYSATLARAHDRLYDEIWSLFFAGDPRVPFAPAAVLRP